MYVIATEQEKRLIPAGAEYIITGVGPLNVFKTLKDIPRNTPIFNVGYAGSNILPIGTKARIGRVSVYHPTVDYNEEHFLLDGNIPCFTFCDFVTDTKIKEPCVFDMELAFILAMGFKKASSEKTVSDNLNLEEYENV